MAEYVVPPPTADPAEEVPGGKLAPSGEGANRPLRDAEAAGQRRSRQELLSCGNEIGEPGGDGLGQPADVYFLRLHARPPVPRFRAAAAITGT